MGNKRVTRSAPKALPKMNTMIATKTVYRKGFTLTEIMIVVAIIGLLAAIAIPNFIKARKRAAQTGCINNLRQIESAKAQWALETKQAPSALPTDTDLFGVGLYIKLKPECPGGGIYTLEIITTPASCDQVALGHKLD